MIKKIAIVPYVTNGRNSQVGHDGHFNIFKKKRSTVLKENLQSAIKAKNWEAEVIVDFIAKYYVELGGCDDFRLCEDGRA